MSYAYSVPLLLLSVVLLCWLQCPTVRAVARSASSMSFLNRMSRRLFSRNNNDGKTEEGDSNVAQPNGNAIGNNNIDAPAQNSGAESGSSSIRRRFSFTMTPQNRQNEAGGGQRTSTVANASPTVPAVGRTGQMSKGRNSPAGGNSSPLGRMPINEFYKSPRRGDTARTNPKKKGPGSVNDGPTDSESSDAAPRVRGGISRAAGSSRRGTANPNPSPPPGGADGLSDHGQPFISRRNSASGAIKTASSSRRAVQDQAGQSSAEGGEDSARDQTKLELATKATVSGIDAVVYSAKLAKKTAGPVAGWLYEQAVIPDMAKVGELAKRAATTVRDGSIVVGQVANSTATNLLPPLYRGTKRYVLPTIGAMARHAVPVTTAFVKASYENAKRLKPIGRLTKPAWRVGRKYMVRPAYNRFILPHMKQGAKKVLAWNEWAESASEAEDNNNNDSSSRWPPRKPPATTTAAGETRGQTSRVGSRPSKGATPTTTARALSESETEQPRGGNGGTGKGKQKQQQQKKAAATKQQQQNSDDIFTQLQWD